MKEKARCDFLEFLLISDSKLKIVMNEEDIKKYKIDTVTSDCTNPLCRRAVWSVLDVAKERVGFDPSGDKVLVQFYPTKGGCEVFVTKLGILSGSSARIVSRSDRVAMLSRERLLYSFDSLSALCSATRAVKSACKENIPSADVYLCGREKYFLHIEEYGKGGESSEFPSILEFGRSLSADFFVYVLEHCELVAKGDGIEKFCSL